MPKFSMKPCNAPGCGTLVHGNKRLCIGCEQKGEANRGSASKRGYDHAWRKLRDKFLRQHPLCECDDCDAGRKRVTASEVVDHIVSIKDRPNLRLVWSNLRAMSKRCHDRRTARDQAFGG